MAVPLTTALKGCVGKPVRHCLVQQVNEIFKLKYKVTTMRTYILVYGVK